MTPSMVLRRHAARAARTEACERLDSNSSATVQRSPHSQAEVTPQCSAVGISAFAHACNAPSNRCIAPHAIVPSVHCADALWNARCGGKPFVAYVSTAVSTAAVAPYRYSAAY